MRTVESITGQPKPQLDLRTGQPYANLIHSQRRFASIIGQHLGVDPSHVLPTPGATGAIEAVRNHIFRSALKAHPVLLTVCPGYWRARESFQGFGFNIVEVKTEQADFAINEELIVRKAVEVQADIVYLSLPNNPTGAVFDPALIMATVPAETAVMFDFTLPSRQLDTQELVRSLCTSFGDKKLFVVGSSSKSHNTAEYRIGWAIAASPEDAGQLNQENRNVVSSIAVEEACRALAQESNVHASIAESLRVLKSSAGDGEFEVVEPPRSVQSSYVLLRLPGESTRLRRSLDEFGIAVMWGAECGLSNDYLRLETSQPENVRKFVTAITTSVSSKQSA